MSREKNSGPLEIFSKLLPATVTQTITANQPGRIRYRASYWPARFYQVDRHVIVPTGQSVVAIGRQGITILVVPVEYAFSMEWKKRIQSGLKNGKGHLPSSLPKRLHDVVPSA